MSNREVDNIYKDANLPFSVTPKILPYNRELIRFSTQDKGLARLVFEMRQGKNPYNLTGVTGEVTLVMANGSRFIEEATILDPTSGTVEYILTDEQLRCVGKAKGELILKLPNQSSVAGFLFEFVIEASLKDKDLEPIEEYYFKDFIIIKEKLEGLESEVDDLTVIQVNGAKKDTDEVVHPSLDSRIRAEVGRLETKQEEIHVDLDSKITSEVGKLETKQGELTSQLADTAKILKSSMNDQEVQGVLNQGGTIKVVEDINIPVTLQISKPTHLISDNKSKLNMLSNSYIVINAPSKIEGVTITTNTAQMSTSVGVITINAKSEIVNCEVNGKVIMTDDYIKTGIGGYGIAIGPGGEGTIVRNNYIHNVSNSFIEAYHNNTSINRPQIKNLTIEDNTLENSETGDGVALNTSHSFIRRNKLLGKWENGLLVHPSHTEGKWCENVVFEDNEIDVDPKYQNTKNGYGIALRYADDKVTATRNCTIRRNVIKGWGQSANGVEGIRIDDYCVNNIIDNNSFGEERVPANGVFIRVRGNNNTIRNHNIVANKGTRVLHIVSGDHILENNKIITNSEARLVSVETTAGFTTLRGNTLESTVSNFTVLEFVTPFLLENNKVVSQNGYALSTSPALTGGILRNNRIKSVSSIGVYIQSKNTKLLYNPEIIGGSDGVLLTPSSSNCMLEGNEISINMESVNKRDALLISGASHVAINNKINSAGRNAIQTTSNCTGDMVVSDNHIMPNTGPIYIVGNRNYTLYLKENNLNGNPINSIYGEGKSVLFYNTNYTLTNTTGHTAQEIKF